MQNIVIIDCGSGNIFSCAKAVERVASDVSFEVRVEIATSSSDIIGADRIILPGQGAFRTCMEGLRSITDMVEHLDDLVRVRGRPFFGICVGMQLLAGWGYEHEKVSGLGWIEGDVVGIEPEDRRYKIPHMGWNRLQVRGEHALLSDNMDGSYVYFVHSYHLRASRREDLLLTCDYGGEITAMVGRDNFAGTQFHPEKSSDVGLSLLRQFLLWDV